MSELIRGDVITKEGRGVEFGKATSIKCPDCGKGENPNMMHIRSTIDNSSTLECPSCGCTMHVPKEQVEEIRDIKGRIVKPRR